MGALLSQLLALFFSLAAVLKGGPLPAVCVRFCREDIFKEIDLLCGMNHENVIYLKEYFEEGNKVGYYYSVWRFLVVMKAGARMDPFQAVQVSPPFISLLFCLHRYLRCT